MERILYYFDCCKDDFNNAKKGWDPKERRHGGSWYTTTILLGHEHKAGFEEIQLLDFPKRFQRWTG